MIDDEDVASVIPWKEERIAREIPRSILE